jgi:hypothetical protein
MKSHAIPSQPVETNETILNEQQRDQRLSVPWKGARLVQSLFKA